MVAQKYNQAKLPLSRKRKVLISAVIVIVIGVVLRMAGPIAQKQILRHTLDKEVAAALAAEYADIDQKLDDRIARMQQILDLPENSMYTVTYDSCYQDSSDTGWMARLTIITTAQSVGMHFLKYPKARQLRIVSISMPHILKR